MAIKTITMTIEIKTLEKAAAERLRFLYADYADDCTRIISGATFSSISRERAKNTFQEIMRLRAFLNL